MMMVGDEVHMCDGRCHVVWCTLGVFPTTVHPFFTPLSFPPTDPGAAARGCALYTIISSLTERLRSVFVPYYRYVFDDICNHLSTTAASAPRAAASTPTPLHNVHNVHDVQGSSGGNGALTAWLLRLRIVRVLHRCCLYDTVGFLEEPRMLRVLPLLIKQVCVCVVGACFFGLW